MNYLYSVRVDTNRLPKFLDNNISNFKQKTGT